MSTSTNRPGSDPDRDPRTGATRTDRPVDADGDGIRDDREVAASDRADGRTAAHDRTLDERAAESDRGPADRHAVRDDRLVADPAVRAAVIDRERERFGGIKFGAAFFGWLTALGLGALLTALLAGTGAALGLGDVGAAVDEAVAEDPQTIGVIGAIALLVVLFVAYFAGGYVAGRMARFNGLKQGVAVWLWAIVMAVVGAAIAALAGTRYDVLATLNTFPRIPVNEGELTVAGIVTLLLLVVVTLGGAILGGKAGTRYHRKVDAAGFGA
ncbi:hypothetical protein GCM10017608_09280 [Agromyces luteolus]|uniref:Uncharacterized protein n=1 Tax=Agromyces luteolus TaxID=88373 RepID=A0A7C9HNA8_9MICO|nr:hypothetical protein [Agromyces luteolus]MUN08462.1 hypothetical protein [Agromyces luteolus]GLK26995.1 hypothetical protein GCM10017608_09280 [Agromyces luteolus]